MKKQTAESSKQQNKGKRSATPKLRCVDLFCGCGGMSLGFEKAGYDVKAGFELWEPAMRVYAANFKHPVLKQDLSNVDEAVTKIAQFTPELIVGGPPCQDFSTEYDFRVPTNYTRGGASLNDMELREGVAA